MANWAIVLCAVLYLITAADLYRQGQGGLAMAFFFYACANAGLLLAANKV